MRGSGRPHANLPQALFELRVSMRSDRAFGLLRSSLTGVGRALSNAYANENGEYGKTEMWYIISAKPGAKLVYDVVPGTTRESFAEAVARN